MTEPRLRASRFRRLAIFLATFYASFVVPTPARAQETAADFDPARTQIHFTLGSTLHTVHGTFKLKSGHIHFDPSTGKAGGSLVVDATSGDTDNSGRDKKMHQEIIQSPKFNEIVFVASGVKGSPAPQGASRLEISGVLQLCGKDHDMTLVADVISTGDHFQAKVHFSVPYVKWGLKNPSTFFLRAEDTVDIDVETSGALASVSTSK